MRTLAILVIYIIVALTQGSLWIGNWNSDATIFVTLPAAVFFIHYIWNEIHNDNDDHRPTT